MCASIHFLQLGFIYLKEVKYIRHAQNLYTRFSLSICAKYCLNDLCNSNSKFMGFVVYTTYIFAFFLSKLCLSQRIMFYQPPVQTSGEGNASLLTRLHEISQRHFKSLSIHPLLCQTQTYKL